MTLNSKLQKFNSTLGSFNSIAIAFSGGVDSTFLLAGAVKVLGKDKVTAMTIVPPYVPNWEIKEAKEFALGLGVKHIIIKEGIIEEVKSNPEDRCYICKNHLFSLMLKKCTELNIETLVDGSNNDDLGDYRPGMKALRELKILSPMLDAKLTKIDIRDLSKKWNLPTWEKPAYACLLTRIPHNTKITEDILHRIEKSELELFKEGYKNIRVRYHGDIARIEMPESDFEKFISSGKYKIVKDKLQNMGYKYITLDLGGYKMGNMNSTGESNG